MILVGSFNIKAAKLVVRQGTQLERKNQMGVFAVKTLSRYLKTEKGRVAWNTSGLDDDTWIYMVNNEAIRDLDMVDAATTDGVLDVVD